MVARSRFQKKREKPAGNYWRQIGKFHHQFCDDRVGVGTSEEISFLNTPETEIVEKITHHDASHLDLDNH